MSLSSLHIREFEPADALPVSSLIRLTMRVSNGADYPLAVLEPLMEYFSPSNVTRLSQERFCLVAIQDRAIVGTIALEEQTVVTFFVHPDIQGGGIGSRLLEALESEALKRGIRNLQVESSVTGVAFYEKRGFRATGKRKDGTAGMQTILAKTLTG